MSKADLYNQKGNRVSDVQIPAVILEGPIRRTLLYEMVRMSLANRRAGTSSTKTRGKVRGSTRKIYRQKGTGNARHGDIKAPIFVGGGRVWGPHPRDYSYLLPKKARLQALKSAIALKAKEGKLKILDSFNLEEIKTKKALEIFSSLGVAEGLVVLEEKNLTVEKSIANLPHYSVQTVQSLSVYEILKFDYLIVTLSSLKKIEERLLS